MLIALDYDGTYTADPELWLRFIRHARKRGHDVIIVTMRYPHENEEIERQLKNKVNKIIYTGRKAKKRHIRFLGLDPTIWIDDQPYEDAAP